MQARQSMVCITVSQNHESHLLCLLLTNGLWLLGLILGRLHTLSQLVSSIDLERTLLFGLGDLGIGIDDTLQYRDRKSVHDRGAECVVRDTDLEEQMS